jgi:hypothetical protein
MMTTTITIGRAMLRMTMIPVGTYPTYCQAGPGRVRIGERGA